MGNGDVAKQMSDVVVIGAGMAGVTAARALSRAGLSVCVVEGRDRIGGRIHSIRDFCAGPVEAGAEFVHGLAAETWPDVRGAGLAVRRCPYTRNTKFDIGHGTHWLPRTLLHPGVWPVFTILRHAARQQPPDRSVREFIERRRYRGRARTLAEMTLTSHLPGTMDEIGMLGLLEDRVLDLETGVNHRIADGYDRLTDFIGRDLDIHFEFVVHEIRGSSVGVTVKSADGAEVAARACVCTLPVGVLQRSAVRFVPSLPESKQLALRQLTMGPVLKVLLRFEERFWPRRLAALVSGVGPVTLYWPVFYGTRDPLPVLTAYCTGPRAAALGRVGEDEAVSICLEDLRHHFPKAAPRLVSYRRIDWTSDPFSCGGYTFLRPGGTGARSQLAAPDTGALFWAGSATATTTIAASVQGAYVTGLRAARQAEAHLNSTK
jgi:monoamine oxidase